MLKERSITSHMLEQIVVKDGRLKTDLNQNKVLASACHQNVGRFAKNREEHAIVKEM